jgi:hypothetical protein
MSGSMGKARWSGNRIHRARATKITVRCPAGNADHCLTLIGEFAARREISSGELVVVPADHPLFQGTQARVPVKSGRPLVAAASELLGWILQRMTMFAGETYDVAS